jgi:hypothetical protein
MLRERSGAEQQSAHTVALHKVAYYSTRGIAILRIDNRNEQLSHPLPVGKSGVDRIDP